MDRHPGARKSPSPDALSEQVQHMSLADVAPADSPEVARFRSLPPALQRRLLTDYPRILATALHQYSGGVECEAILMQLFEGSSEMLAVRNSQGDSPMASALVRGQEQRAEKLVELAQRRNPAALDSRSQCGESLLMLSTGSSGPAGSVMRRLLTRDPTQLHRLYDNDGRNFLHHCAMEESAEPLQRALELTLQLLQQGQLAAAQVSAAIHMNDRAGLTPLHVMADGNRRDMLDCLLQFGCRARIHINVDERQHRDRRWTPLMLAVSRDAVEVAELLLECGADPCWELDTEGQSAEYMAAAGASDRMRRLFREYSEQPMEGATSSVKEESKRESKEESEEVVEGAASLVKEEAVEQPWLTKESAGGMRTVDSGLASFAGLESGEEVQKCPSYGLSATEMEVVECGLRSAGKDAAFVKAFESRYSKEVMLAQMTENPVVTLISLLAHNRDCRLLVRGALHRIGEPQLLDSE